MGGRTRTRAPRQLTTKGAKVVSAHLKNADVFRTGKGGGKTPAILEIKAGPGAHKADFDRKMKDLKRLSDEGKLFKKKPDSRYVLDKNGNPRINPKNGRPLTKTRVVRDRYTRRLERNPESKAANRSIINKLYRGRTRKELDTGEAVDPDHVHELQLGGLDEYDNLRLMDSRTNRALGSAINGALRGVPEGTPVIIRVV